MRLSEIDKAILQAAKEGKTYKEISSEVFRSPEAIRDRLHKLRKLHACKNTVQLVAKFVNLNLL